MELVNKNKSNRELGVFNNFDDFFSPFWSYGKDFISMKTDIQEKKDKFIMKTDVAGFDKKDIDICVEDGYLTIAVNKESESDNNAGENFIRRERKFGSCHRSFYIGECDEESIKANLNKGVLTIEIPKKELKENPNRRHIFIS